jgi:hypothetical protein
MMAKSLELQFLTSEGKKVTISVDEPIEPVDAIQVKQSMDQIIQSDAFLTPSGPLASIEGARVVERNVTEVTVE